MDEINTMKILGMDVHEYHGDFLECREPDNMVHANKYAPITLILLDSGRFFFLPFFVTFMYEPGRKLRIKNLKRNDTYAEVKQLFNLAKSEIEKVQHLYGKEWIPGRGFGTTSGWFDYKYYPEIVEKNKDYVPMGIETGRGEKEEEDDR